MKNTIKRFAIAFSVSLICAPMGAMAADKLIVKDSAGTKDKFVVTDTNQVLKIKDASGTIDKMIVTDSGFVGINTIPTVALHGKGNAAQSQFRAHFNGLTSAGGGSFVMMHNNGGTPTSPVLPNSGDRIGTMLFGTESVNPILGGLSPYYGAGITITADAVWSVTSNGATPPTAIQAIPATIAFQTAGSTGGRVDRFKISSKGVTTVIGALQITPSGTKTCDSTTRGTIWVTNAAAGNDDTAEICIRNASNIYVWKPLF